MAAEYAEETDPLTARDVAALLIKIGAVLLRPNDPFTFASGLCSPIYCDNRIFLTHPTERRQMLDRLYCRIDHLLGDGWDAVAGVATAGIPFAAWVAMHYDKPMVYIRPSEKEHGTGHRIEGGLEGQKRVILIEDLITTGGSALAAVSALRDAGLECEDCFSIFDYGFNASSERFLAGGVRRVALADTDALLSVVREQKYLTEQEIERVKQWHAEVNARPPS